MKPAMRITSAQNLRVKDVLALRESKERRRSGLFVAEGSREIGRALDAGLRVREIFGSEELGDDALDRRCAEAGASRYEVPGSLLEKIAYCENPEGRVAVFEQPGWTLEGLDQRNTGAEATGLKAELWLVAVGTEKPGNLGAMVRTADAAGAAGVLVAGGVVDAFNPNAIRASTGAVFTLPVVGAGDEEVLAFLRKRRVRVFAAALPGAGERVLPHTQADMRGPTAIVIGPEDTGLGEFWLRAARGEDGSVVTIPMAGRTVDSLNASNAAAVLLFEAVRQRGAR